MKCSITWNGESGFKVVEGAYRHVVDLKKQSCSCRSWGLKGIPCAHAIAALHRQGLDPQNFVAHWYHKATYMKAYANCIQPVLNMKMWPESNNPPIEPPEVKKFPGRPKKNRRKSKDEPKKIGKYSRKGTTMTCSFCKNEGHNKKSCQLRKAAGTEGSSSHVASVSTRPAKMPINRPTTASTQRNNSEINVNKQATYKRPRLSGYGVVISERTGFTTEQFGTPRGRVVTTGARNIKNSAEVTGDIGFQPQKLKFFWQKVYGSTTIAARISK
ncbi:uncharacterized protein [Euphorbia lathyris]|uniref:uncharacterized protein n=1 Tax=Euphorbia lathyris TaxID=212925 RepID=UPI00331398C3